MCIRVEYVCVKFGCESSSGYGHLGKTTHGGVIFMGHSVVF